MLTNSANRPVLIFPNGNKSAFTLAGAMGSNGSVDISYIRSLCTIVGVC